MASADAGDSCNGCKTVRIIFATPVLLASSSFSMHYSP